MIRLAPISALVVATMLAGCGRRGELEPSVDATTVHQSVSPSDGDPQVHKKIPPITPPKTAFALDPLLADSPK